jgi:hypothetical protein
LNIGGTGGLITKARADGNHGGERRHLHLQAIHRGNQVHANAILATHPNVIDAFYRFVPSGSTSEPEIFWQGRNGPLLGKQVFGLINGADEAHDTDQRLAIWGEWSGFTIVDRFGAHIELIPHLFGATNRFTTGQRGILYIWRSSWGVTKPNALRLICSELLLDHLRVPTGYPSAQIGGY